MKIITYNVNGLRAALSKGFTQWLEEEQPDVVCLQETKAQPDQIPTLEFEALGYRSYFFSAKKKGYSGVAILTRVEPDHVEYGMGIPAYDDEGRFIRADYGDLSVVSVYHPSGTTGDARQAFKMKWLEDFQHYIGELKKVRPNLILCGDYNICHRPIDIHLAIGAFADIGRKVPEMRRIGRRYLLIPVLSTRSVTSTPKRPGSILGGVTGLTPGQITRDGVLIIVWRVRASSLD